MDSMQVAALIAVGLVAIIYVWRGVQRALRAETEFFQALVKQLARLLEPKGFRLAGDLAQASGLRIATFIRGASVVDAVWEAREREISLVRRASHEAEVSTRDIVARAHVPEGATADAYAAAARVIVDAAEVLDGAA
jgi:hypothetical protein